MRKVTDSELDKLFREAADRINPEFDPHDWEEMAKRLEHEEKAAQARSKSLYTVVTLLVISSLWSQFVAPGKVQTASMLNTPAETTWAASPEHDQKSALENVQEVNDEATLSLKDQTIKNNAVKDQITVPAEKQHMSGGAEKTVEAGEKAVEAEQQSAQGDVLMLKKNASPAITTDRSPATKQKPIEHADDVRTKVKTVDGQPVHADQDQMKDQPSGPVLPVSSTAKLQRRTVESAEEVVVPGQQVTSPANAQVGTPDVQEEGNVVKDRNSLRAEMTAGHEATGDEQPKKTLNTTHDILGEAAAAGNDRLPSSANGEIILMNDGQSQLRGQSQSPSIIAEDRAGESHDGNTVAPAESKAGHAANTAPAPGTTESIRAGEQSLAKDSTQHADKDIAPVQPAAADSGAVQTVWETGKQVYSHSWFVKLPVSPDFSSINYAAPGKPGINIGLLAEYGISRHFSVSTGAIYSKKLYDSKNPDKSYSSGPYTAKANKLDGDCRVLDIPINVTYYLFPEARTNLFVTLGSSSYLMLKERYVYTVWANHQDYTYEENYSHKNNEWFSMLNISIGVQRRFGERFFVQAEPFLKAPMSGVGEGKVNLMSTGVFFSLKYRLK